MSITLTEEKDSVLLADVKRFENATTTSGLVVKFEEFKIRHNKVREAEGLLILADKRTVEVLWNAQGKCIARKTFEELTEGRLILCEQ